MSVSKERVHRNRALVPVALLAATACLLLGITGSAAAGGATASATTTFNSTGAEQTFKVPGGVTSLDVVAVGGRGGIGVGGAPGGLGAVATAELPVTPGQILFVEVGGNGTTPLGGFNGGGNGGLSSFVGGGGGGATDIRTISKSENPFFSSASTLINAAGGGGGGGIGSSGTPGGAGGQAGSTPNPAGVITGEGGPGSGGGARGSGAGGSGGSGAEPLQSFAPNGTPAGGENGSGGGGGGGFGPGGGGEAGSGSGFSPPASFNDGGGGGGGAGATTFAITANQRTIKTDTTGVPLLRITYKLGGGNKSGLKYGKLKLNKNKGTATLPVTVPGSGDLTVGGKGVVKKRPGLGKFSRYAREIKEAGTYKLKIKAKGRKKSKLFDTGKVKVKAVISFKPSSGDKVSDTKRIRLKKN